MVLYDEPCSFGFRSFGETARWESRGSGVRTRVAEGGHDIPKATIIRRYHRGLKNLFEWYYDICNSVAIYDNSNLFPEIVSIRSDEYGEQILNPYKLKLIKDFI